MSDALGFFLISLLYWGEVIYFLFLLYGHSSLSLTNKGKTVLLLLALLFLLLFFIGTRYFLFQWIEWTLLFLFILGGYQWISRLLIHPLRDYLQARGIHLSRLSWVGIWMLGLLLFLLFLTISLYLHELRNP